MELDDREVKNLAAPVVYVSLLKKAVVAGVLAALVVFLADVTQVTDALSHALNGETDYSLVLSALQAMGVGMAVAFARAALGYFTNILPGDSVHGKDAPAEIVVKKK